ncbi:hypothetical protein R6Q59_035209 [Mikania micrantha]
MKPLTPCRVFCRHSISPHRSSLFATVTTYTNHPRFRDPSCIRAPSAIAKEVLHSCPIGGRPIRDPAAVILSSEFCWLLPLIQPAISVLKCPDSYLIIIF